MNVKSDINGLCSLRADGLLVRAMDQIFVSSKICMLKLNHQCDGPRRWDLWEVGHEGEALMNGTSTFAKKAHELTLCSALCHVSTKLEDSHLHTRKRVLTRHQTCWQLDVGLAMPAFGNVKKHYLSYLVNGTPVEQSKFTEAARMGSKTT